MTVQELGYICRASESCRLLEGKIMWALIFEVKKVLEGHPAGWGKGLSLPPFSQVVFSYRFFAP